MNLIRALVSSAICVAAVSSNVNAESIVLFDVKEQCRSVDTTQGVRYLTPCSLPDKPFTFHVGAPTEENDYNRENLKVDFHCESIRPLSMDYQITHSDQVTHNASIAPSINQDEITASFTLSESSDEYTFELTAINGNTGFQVMKPGCKLEVSTSATIVPDELPIGLATKINVATWHASQRVIDKSSSSLFMERLTSAKYRLESMHSVLQETLSESTTGLADIINSVDSLLATCGSTYCPSTVLDEVTNIQDKSKQTLLTLKQQLDKLIEGIEDKEPEENEDYIAWTELRTLIIDTLELSED